MQSLHVFIGLSISYEILIFKFKLLRQVLKVILPLFSFSFFDSSFDIVVSILFGDWHVLELYFFQFNLLSFVFKIFLNFLNRAKRAQMIIRRLLNFLKCFHQTNWKHTRLNLQSQIISHFTLKRFPFIFILSLHHPTRSCFFFFSIHNFFINFIFIFDHLFLLMKCTNRFYFQLIFSGRKMATTYLFWELF